MGKRTIKQLYNLIESPFLISDNIPAEAYPEIEGNTSNFIEDYQTDRELYDPAFVHEYGSMYVDFDSDVDEEIAEEWFMEMTSTLRLYVDSWARLYYALHIDYNPIYNVEEHTETTYGEHVTDTDIGERQHTEGEKSRTIGAREDSSTGSHWAMDSAAWNNTDKTTDNLGEQTNTEEEYTNTEAATTDTVTSNEHVDTVDRSGNIGVVSSTNLLKENIELYKNMAFFKNLFKVFIEELGAYYEYDSLL